MMTAETHDASPPRTVLITGASTGIGKACAIHMAQRGWKVFAGVRKDADIRELEQQHADLSLHPVILDVTRQQDIDAVLSRIREEVGNQGLQGLVNNAGIAIGGPLEYLSVEQIQQQFQVNVFGAISVTQAFLPLLRNGGGRIVFTSSNSGFWCEPFLSIYGGSKHALEAIGDSLRVELRPWRIRVSLVEPGMIKTPIWDKARQAAADAQSIYPEAAFQLYSKPIEALGRMVNTTPTIAASPYRVAYAVRHALEARRPRTRYRVGIDSRVQYYLRRILPDRWRDRLGMWVMGL